MTAVEVDTDSPEPSAPAAPPADHARRRVPRLALELLAVAAATIVIMVPALQLWNADLSVPFVYSQTEQSPYSYAGDASFYLMMSQGMFEHGSYLENPSLGWPNGQQLFDLPHGADNLNLLTIRMLGLVTGNAVAATNLFFLISFVTVALTAYLVLRCFAISRLASGSLALLYAFAPYHFARGTPHLLLSAYFMVPIAVLLIMRVVSDRPPLTTDAARPTVRTPGSWVTVLACAGLASTGAYYGIMTMVLIAAVAPIAAIARRSWRPLVSGALIGLAIAAVMALNLAPSFIYWAQNGRPNDVSARFATETEINGLKITGMFLPAPGHRLFPDLDQRSRAESRVPSERGQNLGFVAAGGVIVVAGSLLLLAFGERRRAQPSVVDALTADDPPAAPMELTRRLGALTFVAIVIAAIGGLALVLSQLGLAEIRSWNRVTIYLMFAGLTAVGFGLDWLRRWLAGRSAPRWVWPLIVILVLVVGCFDQITGSGVPAYARNQRVWDTEQSFIREVTAPLPKGAAVFSMPYITFPEPGAQNLMGPYDQVRGFLARPDLNWSWGESRNRNPNWQADIFDRSGAEQLDAMAAVGFDGLLIDRAGCADFCQLAEIAYATLLDQQPRVSPDRRLSYFDLRRYRADLRARLGDAGVAALRQEVLARGVV